MFTLGRIIKHAKHNVKDGFKGALYTPDAIYIIEKKDGRITIETKDKDAEIIKEELAQIWIDEFKEMSAKDWQELDLTTIDKRKIN